MQPACADLFKILKYAAAACMMHSMHGCSDTMPVHIQDTPEKNADLLEEAADPGDSEEQSEQSLVPHLSPRLNSAPKFTTIFTIFSLL